MSRLRKGDNTRPFARLSQVEMIQQSDSICKLHPLFQSRQYSITKPSTPRFKLQINNSPYQSPQKENKPLNFQTLLQESTLLQERKLVSPLRIPCRTSTTGFSSNRKISRYDRYDSMKRDGRSPTRASMMRLDSQIRIICERKGSPLATWLKENKNMEKRRNSPQYGRQQRQKKREVD